MNIPTRLALICVVAALLPLPRSFAQSSPQSTVLSPADQKAAMTASRIGVHSPRQARVWLLRQSIVQTAQLGRDGQTLDVRFRDGGELAMLPRQTHHTALRLQPSSLRPLLATRDTTPGKAIVLEPFADELGLGSDAGQGEVTPLQAAGFTVDVFRNSQVTVATMESLSNYSVVYMETHSGTLGDGDAIVLTRQTSAAGISDLFKDGSVAQGLAYGDQALYIAIKAQFVLKHMGKFPNSSILFLNGCELLGANVLWDAFHQQNVATLISWDNKVINTLDEQAADFMFPRLAHGETVASNIEAARAIKLGVSTFQGVEAHLGYLGAGDNTFSNALHGVSPVTATPTDTPTLVSTSTPTATPGIATPVPVPAFTFDNVSTFNASGHQTHLFPPRAPVSVRVRYTVRNVEKKATITVKRTYAYRSGNVWHQIGRAISAKMQESSGAHRFHFTATPNSHHTQRISIAITLAGTTKSRTVPITVTS